MLLDCNACDQISEIQVQDPNKRLVFVCPHCGETNKFISVNDKLISISNSEPMVPLRSIGNKILNFLFWGE